MFTMTDLAPYFGKASMKIKDIEFKLIKEEEMSGELAVWHGEKYRIIATPNFDNVPVPVEVQDSDFNPIGDDAYYGEVNSFEKYAEVVQTVTKKILESVV
jgi:hypothetical protein